MDSVYRQAVMLSLRLQAARVNPRVFIRMLADSKVTTKPEDDPFADNKPAYMTKKNFEKKVIEQRATATDAESGQRPTAMQKRFLVITKMYPNKDAIPEYVQHGTMNRMHDRMRVVFIVVATGLFFSIFYIAEAINSRRISRDRDAGKVVTKM